MAGTLRQPIDVPSLERFIASHVPEIQGPITLKQVGLVNVLVERSDVICSLALVNQIRHTRSLPAMELGS